MRLGALLGPIADGGDYATLARQAGEFIGSGYESLWSAQAIGRGFMICDPFIALAVAATTAQAMDVDIELGTAVLQLPLYHPMDVAHRTYSLQQLCAKPVLLGVGAGSTENDFAVYERDFAGRFKSFYRDVDALKASFVGSGGELSPWPDVADKPMVYFGTWGKNVDRAAREFDGWIASGHYRTVDEVCEALGDYRRSGGGRAIVSTLQISGDTDFGEMREKLTRFKEAGFDDAVVMCLPGAPGVEEIRQWVD